MFNNQLKKSKKKDRFANFQRIPLILAFVLLSVYVIGIGSIYFIRGSQTANSLSMNFSYDSDKAEEYTFLATVLVSLEEIIDLAENKNGILDRMDYIDSLENVEDVREALDSLRTDISFVIKQGEEKYQNTRNTDALIRTLSTEIAAVKEFSEELESSKKKANKKEKDIIQELQVKCEKICADFSKFIEVDADSQKRLIEDGNLNIVNNDAKALRSSLTNLSEREIKSSELFERARDNMSSAIDVLRNELVSLSESLMELSSEGKDKFVSEYQGNVTLKKISNVIRGRLSETGEDSLAYAASVVNDNSNNYAQRVRISRDVYENGQHLSKAVSDATYVLLDECFVGSVTSSDGKVLFSGLPNSNDSSTAAFDTLIGNSNLSAFTGTESFSRQILDCYKDVLFSDILYSPFKGFQAGKNSDLTLTIDSTLQESVYQYLCEHNVEGDVLCVNYSTGESLCMVSTQDLNISLRNTSPGSTMKVVTLFLLEAIGVDSSNVWFTCNGKHDKISCTSGNDLLAHGHINGVTAIGESCNCWFAQAIEMYLMTDGVINDSVCDILNDLGYQVTTESDEKTETKMIGKINRDKSVLFFDSSNKTTSLWNLIGETTVEMSPIDMVELIGLFVGNGAAPKAYLVEEDSKDIINLSDKYGNSFSNALAIWKKGFSERVNKEYEKGPDSSYTYSNLPSTVTAAKTGTTQLSDYNDQQRLLMGYSENEKVAFYIVIHNYRVHGKPVVGQDITVADIATYLFERLSTEVNNE